MWETIGQLRFDVEIWRKIGGCWAARWGDMTLQGKRGATRYNGIPRRKKENVNLQKLWATEGHFQGSSMYK